jgi:hypothetical protein
MELMETADQLTCGKGLAENSILPELISKVIHSMAENLAIHMKALDLTDKNASAEYTAYEKLVKELQQSALQLHLTAKQMAGYRDLPMGRHDSKAMTQPNVHEVFERFIQEKQELLSLLEQTAQRDRQILNGMRSHT